MNCNICTTIESFLSWLGCDRPRLIFIIGPVTEQVGLPLAPTATGNIGSIPCKEKYVMFKMSDAQQTTLSLSFTDKRGNPVAQPAGTLSWLVDNPALLSLTPAADNMSCVVASVGPLGTATVSVKLTDSNDATVAAGSLDIEINAGSATNIVMTPGSPTDQP